MKTLWKILLPVLPAFLFRQLPFCHAQSTGGDANVCMMVYQMADTDLEFFLQDLLELTQSSAIKDPSLVTWVYFDARNSNLFSDLLGIVLPGDDGPLQGVFNVDGTPLTEKFEGSRYFTWNHSQQLMVVDTILSGEQDSDNPDTVFAFAVHTLTDCVAKGAKEFMMIFSSHGGGYAGFGGDEHQRRLIQSNLSILNATKMALASVAGAPNQLDVLGFDACLMQSADALDEYREITKYYLASEAVEPGHGWAYNELDVVDSALSMAKNFLRTFLESTQGESFHRSPKTMAIVDTTAFVVFQGAWEALYIEMTSLLQGNDDPDFVAHLKRARTKTVSYEGVLDFSHPTVPAAMDIGSFLQTFDSFCSPVSSSQLRTVLDNTTAAYYAMFVASGVGEGTSAGTGMHISWVSQQEYAASTSFYQPIIFGETTDELPNYLAFLSTFYDTPTPGNQNSTSPVCQVSLATSRLPIDETELLLDPGLHSSESYAEIRSQITRNVDFVYVEFGVDLTHYLSEDLGRRLLESLIENETRRLVAGQPRCHSWRSLMKYGSMNMPWRREQEEGDLFIIYGGDVAYVYNGANVTAIWDRVFYWLESGTTLEPVYVYDDGDGAKSVHVCYFGPANPITSENIPLGMLVDNAITSLGCQLGFLTFSNSSQELGLYVYQEVGGNSNVLSQIPSFIGGQIVPIVHVLYDFAGEQYNEFLGGFNASIFDWGSNATDLVVYALDDGIILEAFESDMVFVDIFAYDFDTNISDYEIFIVEQPSGPPVGAPTAPVATPTGPMEPTAPAPTAVAEPTVQGAPMEPTAPSISSKFPTCNVCGDGKQVGNPSGMALDETISCSDLAALGASGDIEPVHCTNVVERIQEDCTCTSGSGDGGEPIETAGSSTGTSDASPQQFSSSCGGSFLVTDTVLMMMLFQ